jgi:polysaccharide biosynthesis transport protein
LNNSHESNDMVPHASRPAATPAPFVLWPAEPERKNAVEFADITAILRRRRPIIALTMLVVGLAAALYLMLSPRVYEAKATLQAHVGENENDLLTQALSPAQPRSLQTQVAVIENDAITALAIRTLPQEKRQELFDTAETKVESTPSTDLITIAARARTKEDAELLANAVGYEYVKFSQGKNRQSTAATRQYVQNQVLSVRTKLDKAQRALRAFKEQNGVFNLPKEADALVDQAQRLEQAWRDARAQKAASLAQLNETRRVVNEVPPAKIVPAEIRRKPEVEAMKLELARLETEKIRLLQDFTPGSDRVREISGQIEDLRVRLRTQAQTETASWRVEFSPVRQVAQQDVARLRSQIWGLEAQGHAYKNSLATIRRRLSALPERELRLSQLTLDAAALQNTYNQLNERLQALRISEQARVASAEMIFPAQPDSAKQVKPNIPRTIVLAIMAGLVLALGLAALADQLDDRLHSEKEAQQVTNLPVLTSVPYLAKHAGHSLYEPVSSPTPLLETFQLLHTNVEFSAVDEALQVVAVASGLPSEGKSTSALNLAIAAALSGRRVILVDCDLRRPTQHRLLKLPNQVGLSNVLTGAHALPEALQDTDVPGLRVLTGGPTPPNPIRLLKSRTAGQTLRQLREQADFIVLDTPPVLALADAQVVTSHADATLLVISSREIGRRDVSRTLSLLGQSGTEVIGVLLNKTTEKEGNRYYSYRNYGA